MSTSHWCRSLLVALLLGVGALSAADQPPTVATPAAASPAAVTGTSTNLSVLGADDGGEKFLKYDWTVAGPAGVKFSNDKKSATSATFSAAGTYVFTATITDKSNQSVTSSVAVTVAATAASVSITPTTATVAAGGSVAFTASGLDQFGAALTAFTWSATNGTVDGTGRYTPTATSGTATVTATSGVRSASATVTITPPALVITAPVSTPANPITTKRAVFTVAAAGGSGPLTYAWSASGPRSVSFSPSTSSTPTATFSREGSYAITATVRDGAGQSTTSTLNITVASTLVSMTISPTSVVLNPGATRTFTVSGRNQFNARVTPTVTWSATGGTMSGATYTAGTTPGAGSVTATSVDVPTLSATAAVRINAKPTVATPAAAQPRAGGVALSVLGADDGGEAALRYQWSSNRSGVTFSGATQNTNAAKAMNATAAAGTYTFTATIRDAQNLTVTSAVTVVIPANWPPVASAVSLSTNEDVAVAVAPAATDVDSSTLTWSVATPPVHGSLSGFNAATGACTYTPAQDWNGSESFSLKVSDGVTSVSVPVSIVVAPVNDAPVALALNLSTSEDVAIAIAPSANDVDGDVLTWSVATPPAHGSLSGFNAATGACTYTPTANWNGTDAIALAVSDGTVSVPVAVTIAVAAVNDAPVAAALSLATNEDVAVAIAPSASDADGDILTWSVTTPPAHGALSGFDAATGACTYTPAADWNGSESIVLAVSDGTVSVPVAVTIVVAPVNDAPVAAGLSLSTNEDVAVAIAPSASDVDGDTLTWSVTTPPAHGTLSGFDAATGACTYTPAADWNGSESISLAVSDGTVSVPVAVTIAVAAVNDAPVLAGIEGAALWYRDGDAATALTSALTVADIDSANLSGATVRITGNYLASEDVLAVAAQNGISGIWNAGTGTLTMTGSATQATWQAALRAVTYRNTSAFPSTAARTVTVTVSDGQAASNAVARTVALVTRSAAPWSEGFESLAAGADLHQSELLGLTRWHGWDANAGASATVQAGNGHSGGNAVAIAGATDLVHEYKGVNSGGWRYTAWQFIPNGYSGQPYFILLNTYRDGGGARNWSAQVSFNGGSGKVHSDFDGAELPLVTGRWVELRVDIDFARNLQRFSYDGVQLYEKGWSTGVQGTGVVDLAAVDLYANGSAAILYDDLSLTRITPTLANPGAAVAYTENDPATPAAPAITVGDFGVAQLASATVQITGGYQPGQDVLSAAGGTWDATTGTLTLSGAATPAAWQAALRAVTYRNSSEAPVGGARTISYTVSDGTTASNTVAAQVMVTPVDDPAVVTVPASLSVPAYADVVITGVSATDVDSSLTVAISAASGTISLPGLAESGAALVSGTGVQDASVAISGEAIAIAAALHGMVYRAPATAGSTAITIQANGVSATIPVAVGAGPGLITVAPRAATEWGTDAAAVDQLLPTPSRAWRLDVTATGTYYVWLHGQTTAPWEVLPISVDGAGAARVALYAWGLDYWNCQDATWVQTIHLTAGEHLLALGNPGAGTTADRIMLVPVTPDVVPHERAVVAGPGAVAVIDPAGYDASSGTSGHAWVPGDDGAVHLLPDIGWVGTPAAAGGQDLAYDVSFAAAGTYHIWLRGSGAVLSGSVWIALDDADAGVAVAGLGGATPAWSGADADGHPATISVSTPGSHRLILRWNEDGVAVQQIAIAGFEPWRPEGVLAADGRTGLATADLTIITTVDTPASGVVPVAGASAAATWLVATGPAHGTVDLAADGTFTYTPVAGWSGEDGFVVAVGDGVAEVDSHVLVVVTPAIAVAPASATMWPSSSGYAVSWSGAQRLYAIDVAVAGEYTIWLGGQSTLPWNVVQMQLDGADIARVALYSWGRDWWNCQDATWVQTIPLPAGRHILSLDGIDAGTSLNQLMLVPSTPAAIAHDAQIPVQAASQTVIDATDYDDAASVNGFAWQPAAGGGMQAVGDIGWGGDGSVAATQDLVYDVDVPVAGTYRVWILGQGGYDADSVYLAVDGADATQQITGFAGASPTWGSLCYDGSTPAVTIPAAGSHQLHLRMSEDGTTVHQIVLTQDLGWTPPAEALPVTPRVPASGNG